MCQPTGRRYQRTWVQTLGFAATSGRMPWATGNTRIGDCCSRKRKRQEKIWFKSIPIINSTNSQLSLSFHGFQDISTIFVLPKLPPRGDRISDRTSAAWPAFRHSSSQFLRNVPTFFPPVPSTAVKYTIQVLAEKYGDGSKPWHLVNPKIAGIYGCSSH